MKRKIGSIAVLSMFTTMSMAAALTVVTPKTIQSLAQSTTDDLYLYPVSDDISVTDDLSAKRHRGHLDASGNKACANGTVQRATAYGINICVDPKYADKFVAFFASLKEKFPDCGVNDIVCQAWGHTPGSNHVGGGACDVNQKSRNVTTAKCMYHAKSVIAAAGLHDGCNIHDCGHVEAMTGLGHYGGVRHYASRRAPRYAQTYEYAATSRHYRYRGYQQVASYYQREIPMRDFAKGY